MKYLKIQLNIPVKWQMNKHHPQYILPINTPREHLIDYNYTAYFECYHKSWIFSFRHLTNTRKRFRNDSRMLLSIFPLCLITLVAITPGCSELAVIWTPSSWCRKKIILWYTYIMCSKLNVQWQNTLSIKAILKWSFMALPKLPWSVSQAHSYVMCSPTLTVHKRTTCCNCRNINKDVY